MERELSNQAKTKPSNYIIKSNSNQLTRAVFVGIVDDGSGGDLIELVILCECGRVDDDFVLVLFVLSRLASASAFIFCFIASVGSTYHL
jgi:hypothetical protein